MSLTRVRDTRIYRLSPRRALVMPLTYCGVMLIPLFLVVVGLGGDSAALATGLLVAVILSGVFVPFLIAQRRFPLLIFSGEGVELRHLGMTLATPWENVVGVRGGPGGGLILKEALEGPGAGRLAATAGVSIRGATLYTPEALSYIAEHRWIPIEPFVYWLEHGDLGEELVRRAPWLAEQVATARLPRPGGLVADDGKPLPASRVWLIVGLIGLGVLVGVGMSLGPPDLSNALARGLNGVLAVALALTSLGPFLAAWRLFGRGRAAAGIVCGLVGLLVLGGALWLAGSLALAAAPGASGE